MYNTLPCKDIPSAHNLQSKIPVQPQHGHKRHSLQPQVVGDAGSDVLEADCGASNATESYAVE